MVQPTVIGDHLSPDTIWKIRVRVSLSVLALFTLTVIQANRWAPYSYVGLLVNISWFVGLTLFDQQEVDRRFRRQSARIMNFALNYGMSPGRLMSMSGGGELRPDPHPPTVSVGDKDTELTKAETVLLDKPVRVSRYERIADRFKWVI